MTLKHAVSSKRLYCAALIALALAGLSACGQKEKKPGQALASVNGEEITVLQLNEELQRSGARASQQEVASKQLLEVLIDRQLLQNEAAKEKIERDPKVMQTIERSKALIVAQAYMQKRVGNVAKPTRAEIEEYFQKHPEFFSQRKQFDMRQLVIASADLDAKLKAAIDGAKSMEEVAAWMALNNVKFARAQLSRTSTDLAPELSAKLLALPKGQLFIIKEGERSMLIAISEIRDNPVTLEVAAGQIEQFLFNRKNKEAADTELKRLRAAAKIEYLHKPVAAAPGAPAAPVAAVPGAPAAAPDAPTAPAAAAAHEAAPKAEIKPASVMSEANERGVAGLK